MLATDLVQDYYMYQVEFYYEHGIDQRLQQTTHITNTEPHRLL